MFKRGFIVFVLFSSLISVAQVKQKDKTSEKHKAPRGNTRIDKIVPFTGNYKTTGFEVGDSAPEIVFYTRDNKVVSLHKLLSGHVPVLLISGSYTCNMFREHINDINEIAAYYKNRLNIYVIYTLEAHPDNAICPYTGDEFTSLDNAADNIYFPQHTRYKDRKAMADTMVAQLHLGIPVLIDGPDNKWWRTYGSLPNNAYLVDTTGIIKGNNHQLNGPGENIWCYIDSYLGTNSGNCQ
ncbi:MAG: hypothetical protein BGO69_04390 [Bacteroidetes bacterium 46-16]|nr:MAG: hypothetical protein BGO69_04390 [Bacteroidetes bacterium 46-16]